MKLGDKVILNDDVCASGKLYSVMKIILNIDLSLVVHFFCMFAGLSVS